MTTPTSISPIASRYSHLFGTAKPSPTPSTPATSQAFQNDWAELSRLIRTLLQHQSQPTTAPKQPSATRFYFRNDACFKTYGANGSTWLTSPAGDPGTVKSTLADAQRQGGIPVFTQYAVPGRDNGGPSSGGAKSLADYQRGAEANAKAIGNAQAYVVIEPDALALGLNPQAVKAAVEAYRRYAPNAKIYVDAGHSAWRKPEDMAKLLVQAGIKDADGFSLNVSAFEWTKDNLAFGDKVVSALTQLDPSLASKQFVIDTSRNGNGPGVDESGKGTWGDPVRARNGGPITNGPLPTTETGDPHCAAFLWVKGPGFGDNRTRPAGKFGGEAWVKHNSNPPLGPR